MEIETFKNWQVGDVLLDLYQVLEILGDTQVASLYKVRHLGWNQDLMMKVPQPKILQAMGGPENFAEQIKVWADLGRHPHLVTCYYLRFATAIRAAASPDHSCLVFTELVEGETLHDQICSGRLYEQSAAENLARILDIAIKSAWALEYIHEQGAIHGNVCPANLILGSHGWVKLTDLGMIPGRMLTVAVDQQNVEGDRDVPGGMTVAYCSPEQTKCQHLTPSTDSWSWGLLVLAMFQGQRTWSVGISAAQALKNYQETPVVASEVPQMPGEMGWLLRRCFRKNPSARPTFAEISSELMKIYLQVVGVPYPRKKPVVKKDSLEHLNHKALCLIDLGKPTLALQFWEQAVKIQPSHPETIYNRGLTLWRTAHINDTTLVSKLEKINISAQPLTDYLLSLVHLERDDCHQALKILDKIPPIFLHQPEIQAARDRATMRSPHAMGLIRTFEDQTNLVKSVCFSADGRYFLSGSDHNTFKMWDVQTGECLRTFRGHTEEVKSICISGDSKYAISASWDRTLKLWDVETGTCLRSFQPHAQEIFTISLSTDGLYALSGSSDRFNLWQIQTGECLRSFAGHKGDIFSLALSPDGKYALSGSLDKTIKLWDIQTGNCIQTLHGHQKEITSVCFSADGNYALSGSSDHTLKLWQLSTGNCVQTLCGHTSEVTSVCLSPDGNYALSGSSDHTLKLWQLKSGRCLRTFEGHTSAITSLCISPDGALALSGSMDDTLKLWSVRPPDPLYQAPMRLFSEPENGQESDAASANELPKSSAKLAQEVSGVASTPPSLSPEMPRVKTLINQRNYVLAAEQIRQLRGTGSEKMIYPLQQRNSHYFSPWRQLYVYLPKKAFIAPVAEINLAECKSTISAVALSADGRYALSAGSLDKTFQLWLLESGRSLRTFEGHEDQVLSVCLNFHSSLALSGSADKTVKLWGVATGLCVLTLTGHQDAVTSVCFSADGNYIISGSGDRTIKFWDMTTGECLYTLKGHYGAVNSVYPSPDGRYVLSGSADSTVKIWDIQQQKCLWTFKGHQGSVTSVCMSADGTYALSGSADKTLKLWHIYEPKCFQTLEGHTDEVTSVCLTPDGRYALSGSRDQTVKIWGQKPQDSQSAEENRFLCLHTFMRMPGAVNAVSLSADGSYALCGSARWLKLWPLDWELEDRQTVPWDEAARPYLEVFLTLNTQKAAHQSRLLKHTGNQGIGGEIPTWTEASFEQLLFTLGCSGYGWLTPDGVKTQLATMAANWQWLSPFINEVPDESEGEGTELTFYTPDFYTPENLPGDAPGDAARPEECGTQLLTFPEPPPSDSPSQLVTNKPTHPLDPLVSEPATPTVTLTLESGPLKGRKFQFSSRMACVIGRAQDCYIQMPNDPSHQTISRYHCLLDINPPAIRIRDLSSRNGTFVNGKILGKAAKKNTDFEWDLNQGDQVKLGYTSFKVHIAPNPPTEVVGLSSSVGGTLVADTQYNSSSVPAVKGYTTLKFLGQGRVSQVYSVRHDETGQIFALKVMQPQTAPTQAAIANFQRDLENIKALHHPNILQLLDYGYWDDRFFLIFEYSPGQTVAKLMQQQRKCLSIKDAISAIFQVLNALEYAHNQAIPYGEQANVLINNQGLVHGNLKPGNIFFLEQNYPKNAQIKLGDYALDKAFDLAGLSGQTMTGKQFHRPIFMPRQQALNLRYMQTDLDIWAAAACLYFMLTGRFVRDFTGQDPWLVLLQTQAIPIRDRQPNIPKALAELIDLALRDRPHIHFKKAAAFKRALTEAIDNITIN